MPEPTLSVLMTADAMGGVWTYAMELASELAARGVTVALATMGDRPTEAQVKRAKAIPGLTLFESEFKLEWMDDSWADVAAAGGWLLRLAADWQPDLVQLNGYVHGALPWPAPTLMVGHSCVLSWWQAVKSEAAPATWTRYQTAVARGLHAADLVVTAGGGGSPDVAERLVTATGVPVLALPPGAAWRRNGRMTVLEGTILQARRVESSAAYFESAREACDAEEEDDEE